MSSVPLIRSAPEEAKIQEFWGRFSAVFTQMMEKSQRGAVPEAYQKMILNVLHASLAELDGPALEGVLKGDLPRMDARKEAVSQMLRNIASQTAENMQIGQTRFFIGNMAASAAGIALNKDDYQTYQTQQQGGAPSKLIL